MATTESITAYTTANTNVQTQYAPAGLTVLANMWALLVLNLTDADVLPFNMTEYASQLATHEQVLIDTLRHNNITLDLTKLHTAINNFTMAATNITTTLANIDINGSSSSWSSVRGINDALFMTERSFLSNTTLPGRSDHWYKHVIYAPGLYAGYDPVVFPGIVDGIRATVGYSDHPLNISQRTIIGQTQADIAAQCIADAANVLLNQTSPPSPPPFDPCSSASLSSAACIASLIDDGAIAAHLHELTSYPTLAGTAGSYNAAMYVQSALSEYGIDSELKRYDVLLSYPVSTYVAQLDMDSAVLYRCKLE